MTWNCVWIGFCQSQGVSTNFYFNPFTTRVSILIGPTHTLLWKALKCKPLAQLHVHVARLCQLIESLPCRRQTRARTVSWHASFVSACPLKNARPYNGGVLDLCNGAVSEKTPQIFWPLLPVEYVTSISGWKDVLDVRCWLTDTQTDRRTDPTTVTLAAHACRGLIKFKLKLTLEKARLTFSH